MPLRSNNVSYLTAFVGFRHIRFLVAVCSFASLNVKVETWDSVKVSLKVEGIGDLPSVALADRDV